MLGIIRICYKTKAQLALEDGRFGKDIDFIHATVKRKKVDEAATISVRSLYVLKEKYIGKALDLFLFSFIYSYNM